jgi:CBS domain-containing protein
VLGRQITAFVAVPRTATMADARMELSKAADCKDVFVTDNGQKTGRVLGWLTNSDLARAA